MCLYFGISRGVFRILRDMLQDKRQRQESDAE